MGTETLNGDLEWWRRAACAGRDPEWWADRREMRSVAVQTCITCPVKRRCLDDAVRRRDTGVIRGGVLLGAGSRGYSMTSLVCMRCGRRPVRDTPSGAARYCATPCRAESVPGPQTVWAKRTPQVA